VICLCAQFEAVLQHGLKKSRGLALTAAAIKQAAGFTSKTETDPVFWVYIKEILSKHELQRFCSLKNINTDIGRGRAWLRCALNEHSLERYVHMLLGDSNRLSFFYEDWSFLLDEERSSMLPTMAAGLNSILFAINIDNKDLNGQVKYSPTVSDLLKESTQNVTSLLKESTQGVSSLLKEITASSAVSILIKPEQNSDPLPVLSKSVISDGKTRKDRKKKKKVSNIISFDDDDGENLGDGLKKPLSSMGSSEENSDRSVATLPHFENQFELNFHGNEYSSASWKNESVCVNGDFAYQKLDVKSIDDEDLDDCDSYEPEIVNKGTRVENSSSDVVSIGSMDNSQGSSWPPLQVLHDNSVLFPVNPMDSYSQSDDNLDNIPYGKENVNASLAVNLAQIGSDIQYSNMEATPSAAVTDNSSMAPLTPGPESMTVHELQQVVLLMVNRKDELEEKNTSLRNLLDAEMEHSSALRLEIDNLKRKASEQEERHAAKIQALARENEVLKVQLKKYVGAVQMLKRDGQTDAPNQRNIDAEPTPEVKSVVDNEELANSYERKLIEVAEMHGELMEFNERLHRTLMAKEVLVSQMRQELIDLRGPVPGDLSQTSEDQSLSDFEISHRALINVWIPSVFLRGKSANAFHVYQVYIRIKDDEWNIYRRYAEFRSLHHKLENKYLLVRNFHFPPKKAIGNKDAKFVEERRKQLQNYLRNIMNKVIQTLPEFVASLTKKDLHSYAIFYNSDIKGTTEQVSKGSRSKVASRFSKLSRSHQRESRNLEPQSGDL
ncbi:hypothetical protein GDO86_017272, partial [Hymenochirus boettgeri]